MKIVNIILTSRDGGAEQVFIDYSLALKNLGHEVLAVIKNDAPYADRLSIAGINVKKITNGFGYYDIFAIKNIKNILDEFGADAVISHVGRSMILVRKALKKIADRKIFFVAVNHSMNVKRSIGADLVISVNREAFYRTIRYGQLESKSFVIPNATDLTDIHVAAKDEIKIDLCKKDKIIIGVIGRFEKGKGFYYAIKAIKELEKRSNKSFVLKIAGLGEDEKSLRELAKEMDVEKKVEFLGWIKNKKEFFESLDIFCLSSLNETFGLVLLEAMKYRKPIVSTNVDGPKEILRDGIDAILVQLQPLHDTEKRIADAIIRIINDPDLATNLVKNSFIRLNEKFSHQALENNLAEIFGRNSKAST